MSSAYARHFRLRLSVTPAIEAPPLGRPPETVQLENSRHTGHGTPRGGKSPARDRTSDSQHVTNAPAPQPSSHRPITVPHAGHRHKDEGPPSPPLCSKGTAADRDERLGSQITPHIRTSSTAGTRQPPAPHLRTPAAEHLAHPPGRDANTRQRRRRCGVRIGHRRPPGLRGMSATPFSTPGGLSRYRLFWHFNLWLQEVPFGQRTGSALRAIRTGTRRMRYSG